MNTTKSKQSVPIWLFGLLVIPYGAAVGFATITMPRLLDNLGMDIKNIGWYTSALLVPSFTQFLYAPILDVGFKRKTWLICNTLLAAFCLGVALIFALLKNPTTCLCFLFLAQVFAGLIGSCCGGFMVTLLSNQDLGKASGWYNAGNLGAAAICAAITLGLAKSSSPVLLAVLVEGLMIFPLIGVFWLTESSISTYSSTSLKQIGKELWNMLSSKKGLIGIIFCLSPVGSVALGNSFTAVSAKYQMSEQGVALIHGLLGGMATALGSLVGGYLCDRINRKYVYLAGGMLTFGTGLGMMISPMTPITYTLGVFIYLWVSGFVYAAFSSVVLETVGKTSKAASTQYTLLNSIGNLAVSYMVLINTHFCARYGVKALFGSDAFCNLVGVLVLFCVMILAQRFFRSNKLLPKIP